MRFLVAIVMLMIGCKGSTPIHKRQSENIIGSYNVISMTEVDAKDILNKKLTINFNTNGKVSGYNGCNNYSASYSISDNSLEIGMMMTTERYCEDELQVDGKLMKKLKEAERFELIDNKLVFLKGSEKIIEATKVIEKE